MLYILCWLYSFVSRNLHSPSNSRLWCYLGVTLLLKLKRNSSQLKFLLLKVNKMARRGRFQAHQLFAQEFDSQKRLCWPCCCNKPCKPNIWRALQGSSARPFQFGHEQLEILERYSCAGTVERYHNKFPEFCLLVCTLCASNECYR